MTLPIKIVPRAAREITEARDWWQANRPAAPEVLEEVRALSAKLARAIFVRDSRNRE